MHLHILVVFIGIDIAMVGIKNIVKILVKRVIDRL